MLKSLLLLHKLMLYFLRTFNFPGFLCFRCRVYYRLCDTPCIDTGFHLWCLWWHHWHWHAYISMQSGGWFCIAVSHINKVKLHWAGWVLWLVVHLCPVSSYIFPDHSGLLGLAIPPVGAMSTGDVFGYWWGRNGEFFIAVGPVSRTAGILA